METPWTDIDRIKAAAASLDLVEWASIQADPDKPSLLVEIKDPEAHDPSQ